jgi:hypothetical protein
MFHKIIGSRPVTRAKTVVVRPTAVTASTMGIFEISAGSEIGSQPLFIT